MSITFPLPVRTVGPGSQADDEPLQYLDMPREMNTFVMPSVPEAAPPSALRAARDVLARFRDSCDRRDGPVAVDLLDMAPEVLGVINEVLGEGEVAVQVGGSDPWRIQETVFTGVWRAFSIGRDGTVRADRLELAPVPAVALKAARDAALPRLPPVSLPSGAMNSPALLRELEAHVRSRHEGAAAHVLNLSLLPMSDDDHLVLERALPVGPVAMIARGFGNCRITSTGARDVWRVQYFNSMNTMILNTIEVVDVPEVALAAPEDLADSKVRLGELLDWMTASCEDTA